MTPSGPLQEYPCVDDLVHVIRLLQRQEEEYEVIVRSLTEKLAQCQELSSRHDARCAENARLIEELIVMKAGLEMVSDSVFLFQPSFPLQPKQQTPIGTIQQAETNISTSQRAA